MIVKLYDKIMLKDKREGIVIEVYKQGEGSEVEFMVDDTGEYPEYETETIRYDDIEKIINKLSTYFNVNNYLDLETSVNSLNENKEVWTNDGRP